MKSKLFLSLLILVSPTSALAQGLPHSVAEAQKMEREDALPTTPLYANPTLGTSGVGDLLAQEPVTNYSLPVGAAVRIAYHSRDAAGRDVPATAAVLIPPGKTPSGGWPVIAWAHGTSGVARQCAPSLMKISANSTTACVGAPLTEKALNVLSPSVQPNAAAVTVMTGASAWQIPTCA